MVNIVMSATDPPKSPFVSYEKLVETIDVLKKVIEINEENAKKELNAKKPLLEDRSSLSIILEVNLKKIPINRSTFIHYIDLPHHWRHEIDSYDTCLIVKDVNKQPLTDRELDLETTKSFYRKLLSDTNAGDSISEILPMRELVNEYKVYEAKIKLCNAFDRFLVDRKLMRNKFDHLPRFLGKAFWFDARKVPIPIDLSDNELKSQCETKLNQTPLYLTGKGTTTAVNIGVLKQSTENVAQNLLAVTRKLKEIFDNNIRSLKLKTSKSMSIIFYLDCEIINDITLPYMNRKPEAFVDEFSHFNSNASIKVFPYGDVAIIPNGGNDDGSDVDDSEKLFIKKFNRNSRKGNRRFKRTLNVGKRRVFRKRKPTDKTGKSGETSKKLKVLKVE